MRTDDGRDLQLGLVLGFLLIAVSIIGGPAQASGRAAIVNGVAVIVGLGLVAFARTRKNPHSSFAGQWSVALFALFVAFSAFSITWSVDPSSTWQEVNRLLGYLAVFTAAVLAARTFPERWRTVLLGLAMASVAMSAIALASKISPELLSPNERYARLREPLQYWNAVGLIAAFGVPLWLYYGTRRVGRPVLDILAAPALTILFVTLMLSYSRGSLIAAIVGAAVWLALAPARLKTVATLIVPLVGAAIIVLWAFGQSDLTTDDIDLLVRETAGHRFGAVIVSTLAFVTLLSLMTQFLIATRAPTGNWRRRVGIVLLGAVLLVPVAGAAALSQSERGLTGTISNGWQQLTDPDANQVKGSAPANSPDRLGQVGNQRTLYWRDAIRIAKANPVIGTGTNSYGTARLRHRTDAFYVAHAHGFLVQVAADLGLVGVGLCLALLGAFLVAAWRTISGKRGDPWPPERVGAVALLAAVFAFGVHSFLDWTWSFPAATIPALIAAGWLAGRGPIARPRASKATSEQRPEVEAGWLRASGRWVPRAQILAFAVLAVWSISQPYRAFKKTQEAYAALGAGRVEEALSHAERAVQLDSVSIETYAAKSAALAAGGDIAGARAAIEDGLAQQPKNPDAWTRLLTFEIGPAADADRAVAAYRAALFLDPYSVNLRRILNNALGTPLPPVGGAPAPAPAAPAAGAVPAAPAPDPVPESSATGGDEPPGGGVAP
ncbi:MAG: O-antigen ligase family protein [Solirubrobacteraceae bacterium]|nr:O-antigen ligase family protein [Solirubrobacteraceae bacterium]